VTGVAPLAFLYVVMAFVVPRAPKAAKAKTESGASASGRPDVLTGPEAGV
jgi:hypothetical protein